VARKSYIRLNDDVVLFVMYYINTDLHSARSLKQQSTGRHICPLLIPNQPVCSFSIVLRASLSEKQQIPIL